MVAHDDILENLISGTGKMLKFAMPLSQTENCTLTNLIYSFSYIHSDLI